MRQLTSIDGSKEVGKDNRESVPFVYPPGKLHRGRKELIERAPFPGNSIVELTKLWCSIFVTVSSLAS